MAALSPNAPGFGIGVSGPAYAKANPRPSPLTATGTQDGPKPKALQAAWHAYNGRFAADGGDDGPLAAQAGVPDLNVHSNRLRPIVNTGVDFLFGPMLSIKVEDTKAQAILDAAWGDDDLRMTLLSKSAINGGIYGHVFFKVVPPKRGAPSVDNPPRLVLLNPETISVDTDPDDADLVCRFTIEYLVNVIQPNGQALRKKQVITRIDPDDDDASSGPDGLDTDTSWEIQNWIATGPSGMTWQEDGPAQTWDYELPPIIDWQNYPNPNTHWGQADITDGIISLNRQLRLVESNINKIGFLQGHPYLYSSGADTGGIKPTPGQILDLGAQDAKLGAVDASGDLAQLMAFAETLRSDMDEESGIPGSATGRIEPADRGGPVSGVAMRLRFASALSRNEHKRRLYGQGIRQICQTVLCVCGMTLEDVEDLEFELVWQDPLPNDNLAEAQTAVALQGIGYSQHSLILMTGGDPEVEEQYKDEEQQKQVTAFSQGKGMPPTSPDPNTPPDAPGAESDGAAGQAGTSQGQPGKQGNIAALQSPAAKAAQQKASVVMKAAFGKS